MTKDKFQAKGKMIFRYTNSGIQTQLYDRDYYLKQHDNNSNYVDFIYDTHFNRTTYDLMTGKGFYKDVDDTSLIDYDGSIADIFVDGYLSNLGLAHKGMCQGDFLVDGEVWLELCNEHTIKVNWANK
jgi:hypothetical protein